mmetsp:Transcript_20902/g.18535  ORF Transcript_20902/g.18535 Transcript_20902/m.18535 type:complete len:198 (-) Transcript_20902:43-636(-)
MKRTLISKYSYMNRLIPTQFMNYHTIGKSRDALEDETPINVYEGKEFEELSQIKSEDWFKSIAKSSSIKKYTGLLPFFIEAKYNSKNFVLKMDLLPNNEYLRFYTLTLNGIAEKYEPLKYVVPVTKYDYRVIYGRILFKQHQTLDLDMVYGNYGSKELYVFDKYGTWDDEGLNHDKLSLENTFNETNWFDEFTPEGR